MGVALYFSRVEVVAYSTSRPNIVVVDLRLSSYNDESFYLNYIISLSSPTPPLLRIRNNFLPIISVIVLNRAIRARRDIYMPRKFSMPAALPDAMARQTRFPAEVRDRVTCFRHEFETIERWSR